MRKKDLQNVLREMKIIVVSNFGGAMDNAIEQAEGMPDNSGMTEEGREDMGIHFIKSFMRLVEDKLDINCAILLTKQDFFRYAGLKCDDIKKDMEELTKTSGRAH